MAKRSINDFRIVSFQPTGEVTGSNILVEVDNLKILLDFGMFQSQAYNIEDRYKINEKLYNNIQNVDYILLSSSHADHCCGVGIVGNDNIGFKGKIITTELVSNLAKLNIMDCAYLMEKEVEKYNKFSKKKIDLKPLYTMEQAEKSILMIQGYGYYQDIVLNDKVTITLLPNGHLSGDCSIFITYQKSENEKKRLLYTGDIYNGKYKRPYTMLWDKKCYKADCVIIESTYGGVEETATTDPINLLEQYIMTECIQNNRTLFIPVFAIHRSTHILWLLKQIYERNAIIREKGIPIYACGNMLYNAHQVIGQKLSNEFYDEEWKNDDLFTWNKVKFIQQYPDVVKCIQQSGIKIVIATGGMIQAHSKYICTQYIPQKNVSILFCGYQADGTLGRAILNAYANGDKKIVIDNEQYTIRAHHLGVLDGLSGHAKHSKLIQIVQSLNQRVLKKVIIVHGDTKRKQLLKEGLEHHLNGRVEILIPKQNDVIKF